MGEREKRRGGEGRGAVVERRTRPETHPLGTHVSLMQHYVYKLYHCNCFLFLMQAESPPRKLSAACRAIEIRLGIASASIFPS